MTRLFTLTGNLLAETTATYAALAWGTTHRAESESFQVGGKGINVARMAQRLGIESTAVCFPGGHTGDRCLAWLKEQPFAVEAFRQEAETRSGWVVRSGGEETTFLGRDREIEEKPWKTAIEFLGNSLSAGDAVAICGSFPGWRPELREPLKRLLTDVAEEVFVAVDTYGSPLTDLARFPVDLIKINREEVRSLTDVAISSETLPEILESFRRERSNVRRWAVTGGKDPVFALEENGRAFSVKTPAVNVVSPVGCGDVLLAGLIDSLARKKHPLESALRDALPLAAANAASPGIADFEVPPV